MTEPTKARSTALVTGGAKRIGREICLALTEQGYNIALHYHRSKTEATRVSNMIKEKGGACKLFACNLSDPHQAQRLIPNALKHFSQLDVLVNNASIFKPTTLKSPGLKSLREHFAVNFEAPYILTAEFARTCRKGQIINILDTHVTRKRTSHAAYLLSKKALGELTRMAAAEFAPAIRVNAVAPGLILPPKKAPAGYFERMAKDVPLRKKGHPDQIIQAILFLLNNDFVTGQTIFVDGGEHLI